MVIDATMLHDLSSQNPDYSLIRRALNHTTLIASFQTQDVARITGIQIFQVQHMVLI